LEIAIEHNTEIVPEEKEKQINGPFAAGRSRGTKIAKLVSK